MPPRALSTSSGRPQARGAHGHSVPDEHGAREGIADGVDVYAVRPEAFSFPKCNHDSTYRNLAVWGYFFTTRPLAAAVGGFSEIIRYVAAGGRWCCCGLEKGYAGDDGDVFASRTGFAFYEDDGKLTTWRMKEYRINEDAARFRGVEFHPGAANLVVWKVYKKVEIAREEPPMEYYSSDDDDENEA